MMLAANADHASHAGIGLLGMPDQSALMPALRAFITKRGDGADVDDVVQEVAIRLHRRGDKDISNPSGYIFQVAANVIRDRRRREQVRRRSAHCELTEFHHPADHCSPERTMLAKEDLNFLLEQLNALPERTRHVFILIRFEDMSYQQAADRFGISVSAVEKHVAKSMRRLSEAFRERDEHQRTQGGAGRSAQERVGMVRAPALGACEHRG